MTSPYFGLAHGARTLALQSGRYNVYPGWRPPEVAETPQYAAGTSANQRGPILVGKTRRNIEMTVPVNVAGASTAEIRRAIAAVEAFLAHAGDQTTPLYFVFCPSYDAPAPLWGQRGWLYYEITYGQVIVSSDYLRGNRMATDVDIEIVVSVKSPVGLPQRLGSSLGRIHEDNYGTVDGLSRGLVIAPALTNKMTNPVFGNATYDTGWTADASLTASKNTDAAYLLPNTTSSVYLQSRATGQEYYQSINAGNTNTHTFIALIMLPDKGTPSSSDMQIYYNTALTTTFTSLGDGLWMASASAAGIASATNTGVQVKSGRSLYLLYMGMCETANRFFPFWGDNLGCAWSGTEHASTSTSTAGRWRLPVTGDTWSYQTGAACIVWTPQQAYSAYASANYYLLDAGSLELYFNATTDAFVLTDGTNTITSATTFAAGAPIVFHVTWSASGLTLYINGAQAGTGSYAFPAAASDVYLGTNSSAANHCLGTFSDFTVWRWALTAQQVSDDYATISRLTEDGDRVSLIPWLWTKDGDDTVDNCDDSTRDNWCVVGGVPGSDRADTLYVGDADNGTLWMGLNPLDYFLAPGVLYDEFSGTADANSSGGAYQSISTSTSEDEISVATLTAQQYTLLLAGREVVCFTRSGISASSLQLRLRLRIGPAMPYHNIDAELATVTSETAILLCKTRSLYAPSAHTTMIQDGVAPAVRLALNHRVLSGTASHSIDYAIFVVGHLLTIQAGLSSVLAFALRGLRAVGTTSINGQLAEYVNVYGRDIDLYPGKTNLLVLIAGSLGSSAPVDATTTLYITVTPRYTLL